MKMPDAVWNARFRVWNITTSKKTAALYTILIIVLSLHCHYRGSDKDGKDEPLTKIEMLMKKKRLTIAVWFLSLVIDLSKVLMIKSHGVRSEVGFIPRPPLKGIPLQTVQKIS